MTLASKTVSLASKAPLNQPVDKVSSILQASLRLFNQYGFNGVTSMDIANELEMSPGHLYYYFRGKQSMLDALMQHAKIELTSLRKQAESTTSITQVCSALCQFLMRYQCLLPHTSNEQPHAVSSQLASACVSTLVAALSQTHCNSLPSQTRTRLAYICFALCKAHAANQNEDTHTALEQDISLVITPYLCESKHSTVA